MAFHGFKNMRTTQEHRANTDPEYTDLVRHKRLNKNLNDAWDDIKSAKPQRSWKRHRKNRWK